MATFEGKLTAEGLRVAVVVSRFNGFVTEPLLAGALDALRRHGAREADIDVYRVPGAFEIAPLVRRLARAERHEAIVALGAVIRGATPHFDLIAGEVAKGLGQVALEGPCAISFGVLTTESLEQAIERAGSKAGNKGADAALAAIEQANLFRELAAHRGRRRRRG